MKKFLLAAALVTTTSTTAMAGDCNAELAQESLLARMTILAPAVVACALAVTADTTVKVVAGN